MYDCTTEDRNSSEKKIRDHFNQNIVNFQNSAHDYIRDFSTYNKLTTTQLKNRTDMFLAMLYLIHNFCPIRNNAFPIKKYE